VGSSTEPDLRRRRGLATAHSLVINSKTSCDSYRAMFFPSGIGPINPLKIGIPRRSRSVLLSSTPTWVCVLKISSAEWKSRILREPSAARVTTRNTSFLAIKPFSPLRIELPNNPPWLQFVGGWIPPGDADASLQSISSSSFRHAQLGSLQSFRCAVRPSPSFQSDRECESSQRIPAGKL